MTTQSIHSVKVGGKHIGNVFAKTSKGWLATSIHWGMKAYHPTKSAAVNYLKSIHQSACGQ